MWPNPQFPADLFIFTEEILNGKLHFLCGVRYMILMHKNRISFFLINHLLSHNHNELGNHSHWDLSPRNSSKLISLSTSSKISLCRNFVLFRRNFPIKCILTSTGPNLNLQNNDLVIYNGFYFHGSLSRP